MSHRIEIEFSAQDRHKQALDLAADVLDQWAHELAAITLVPNSSDGTLAVVLDGDRIFSSSGADEPPEPAEINSAIEARLGPPPGEGA